MPLPELDLSGRRAVVTAGGRGIGKGIALALAEAGADVVLVALTPTYAASVAEQVRALGRSAAVLTGDMTREADVATVAAQTLDALGGLDILVNAVGDALRQEIVPLPQPGEGGGASGAAMTLEQWHTTLDINLTEAFLCCRAFGPHLLGQRRGAVINISGGVAKRAAPRVTAYGAAKAGLVQFTAGLALEWAPYGVRVNCIAPGGFPDPDQMTEEQYAAAQARAAAGGNPLGRTGRLRDVGLLAAFLASDAAAYITGQTIYLDGGANLG